MVKYALDNPFHRTFTVNNTIGGSNIAVGFQALSSNTTGEANVAVGTQALLNNTNGSESTAVVLLCQFGSWALRCCDTTL